MKKYIFLFCLFLSVFIYMYNSPKFLVNMSCDLSNGDFLFKLFHDRVYEIVSSDYDKEYLSYAVEIKEPCSDFDWIKIVSIAGDKNIVDIFLKNLNLLKTNSNLYQYYLSYLINLAFTGDERLKEVYEEIFFENGKVSLLEKRISMASLYLVTGENYSKYSHNEDYEISEKQKKPEI